MRKFLRILPLAAAFAASAVQAGTVTIVTSFPKELTDTYKRAFEAKNPGISIEVLNKNTAAGIAYVRESGVGQRPDVFWVSDPSAFEVLARDKLLLRAPELANPQMPTRIGSYPVNDPEGMYFGQAISGYGLMSNRRYLQANKLPAPREWVDLTKPVYFSHVAMSSPSRSGTTHLTVETILQGEGWQQGWSQLLQIGSNCATIADRSYGVPDGVNNGQFGIGLVIDFFGLSGAASGFPVDFVYPTVTAIVPANIGIVSGGRNVEEARKFVAYTLSLEGQQLLFDPKVSRIPVLPYSTSGLKVPAGYPNIQEIASRAKVRFDSELAEQRHAVVTSLFDQTITFRLKELQAAQRAIIGAERQLAAGSSSPRAAELLAQARATAFTPLVTDAEARSPQFLELFRKNRKDVAVARQIAELEENWSSRARANYVRAEALAREAGRLAK